MLDQKTTTWKRFFCHFIYLDYLSTLRDLHGLHLVDTGCSIWQSSKVNDCDSERVHFWTHYVDATHPNMDLLNNSLLFSFKWNTLYSLSNMHFKRAFWKKLLSISKSDASIVKIEFSSKISNDLNPCKLKIETQIYWQLLHIMQIGYIYEFFICPKQKSIFVAKKHLVPY